MLCVWEYWIALGFWRHWPKFLCGVAEFFREPDAHIGFLTVGTTMGQWLSLPMLIAGIWLVARSRKNVAA